MFKDEKLKAIYIIKENTREILAFIDENGNVVNSKDILVIEDYSNGDEEKIIEKDGTFYLKGE